jgi:DNA-binding transcriptional MerR regulator
MKRKKRKVLWESASAGRVLEVSPAQVRKMADRGLLPIEATTPRGGRLFRADAVERLRRRREAVRAARGEPTGHGADA